MNTTAAVQTTLDPTDPNNPNRALYMGAVGNDVGRITAALNSGDQYAIQSAVNNLLGAEGSGGAATASNGAGKMLSSGGPGGFTPQWFQSLNPAAQQALTGRIQSFGPVYSGFLNTLQTPPTIDPMQGVIRALGTAANTFSRNGMGGIWSDGTNYVMNPDGTFSGGIFQDDGSFTKSGAPLSVDQLKQIVTQNGQAGVPQYNDVPQGGGQTPTQQLQAEVNANPNASSTQLAALLAQAQAAGIPLPSITSPTQQQGYQLGAPSPLTTPQAGGPITSPTQPSTASAFLQSLANPGQLQAPGAISASILGPTVPGIPQGTAPPVNGTTAPPTTQGGNIDIGANTAYQYQAQGPFTYNASQIQSPAAPSGTQGFNAGQDGLMQMLQRQFGPGNPGGGSGGQGGYSAAQNTGLNRAIQQGATNMPAFNTSPEEQAVNNLNMFNLQKQTEALQGSAGSLGQRFGTAMNYNEGQLRANALTNNAAQLQQIAQSSFNTQQQNQLQAQGLGIQNLQNYNANTLQGLMANQTSANQAGQFNAAAGQTASAQNAQQGNIYNNLMTSILGNASNLQGQQNSMNTSLLGLLAGLGVPQVQGSPYGSAAGQIGQIATLYPFLQNLLQQNQQQPTG